MVGAGVMGSQIAYQAALAGHPVTLMSRSQERLDGAAGDCGALLRKRVEKGKLDGTACEEAIARVRCTTDLDAAVSGAAVIIESVAEDRDVKREVLGAIGEAADGEAIIGSNSSTMPSSFFAGDVARPERLLNVHFMNPALVMQLVEVVRGPHTAQWAVDGAMEFARGIGKVPVLVEKETYGFIANRILFIAMQEAFRLVDEGYVSIADCDLACRNGLGWPMGPFELADLVGLDVVEAILSEGHRQTGEERWAPPQELTGRVQRGELGRKSGSGFTLPS